MAYLLDTNTLSRLSREPQGDVAARIVEKGLDELVTSVIVAGEVEYGLARKQSKKLRLNMEAILQTIKIMPLDETVYIHYGAIRADLQRKGTPIGPNDLWIAAHALSLDAVLVTDNEREFSRVSGLKIENWLR